MQLTEISILPDFQITRINKAPFVEKLCCHCPEAAKGTKNTHAALELFLFQRPVIVALL